MSLTTRSGSLEGKRFGNYIAFELLGQGGMGSVYLAEHPEIGRKVAIKVLARNHSEEMVQRFLDEAKAVTRIGHPNIIDIYDFGRTESGRLYYVMEWLDGKELRAVMNDKMPMNAHEVRPYLEQICAAIQAAHEQGVVHRDLKPANIFVLNQEPPVVKVLDFGVAKLLDTQLKSGLTSPGILIGTPMFSAPEQAAAELDRICPQTDIYSLGVMVYWMLTGQPPFMADNNSVLLAMHITDTPRPPREIMPSIPAAVAELVEQCLAKEPEDRPATARGLAAAFAAALKRDEGNALATEEKFDDGPSGILVFLPDTPVEEVLREPTPVGDDDRPEPVAGEADSGEGEDEDRPQPEQLVEVTERPTQPATPATKLPTKPQSDAEAIAAFLAGDKAKPGTAASGARAEPEPIIPTPRAKAAPVEPRPGPEAKIMRTPRTALNAIKPAPALAPEPALVTNPSGIDDEDLPETQVDAEGATVKAGPDQPAAPAVGAVGERAREADEQPGPAGAAAPADGEKPEAAQREQAVVATPRPTAGPVAAQPVPSSSKIARERATAAVQPLHLPAAPPRSAQSVWWLWALVAVAVAVAVVVALIS